MSDGRPRMRPGKPSPFKKFWVIRIKGKFIRLEGAGILQFDKGPTPFLDTKKAEAVSSYIPVGELHFVELLRVNRAWLESVAIGEKPEVKVDIYTFQR